MHSRYKKYRLNGEWFESFVFKYIKEETLLEFSDLTLATGTGKDNTTYQQLRWYPSVLDLLVV